MFRLNGFPDEEKDDKIYLDKIAGETISAGLEYVYGKGKVLTTNFVHIMTRLGKLGFWSGLSQYIHEEGDTEAGIELSILKMNKMIEKMNDPTESYSFDVFEELLFYLAITHCDMLFKPEGKSYRFYDREKEKEVKRELKERFHYSEKRARKIAGKVTRFHKMALGEDEEENMFFWDNDFQVIFCDGFVEGIRFLKGFGGERLGYGYDYTREIFTDIGLKPPLKLLGTKEANRIVNEEAEKRFDEILEKMIEDLKK